MDEVDFIQRLWWTDLTDFGDLLRRKRESSGITQAQMAAKIGIDRSRISRIERGLGTPKGVPTATAFADAYNLNGDESREMFRLWFGTDPKGGYLRREIEIHNSIWSDMLYKIRIDGSPKLVIAFVKERSEHLRDYIRHLNNSRETVFYKKILANMFHEQATALMEVAPKSRIRAEVESSIKEMINIAQDCQDISFRGLANLHLGDTYYITGNYQKSLYYLEQAWPDVKDVDAQLRLLRIKALDLAYLNEKTQVKKVGNQIFDIIEQGKFSTFEHVSLAYEGLGQAQSLVYLSQAFDNIQRGRTIYKRIEDEGKRAPIRCIQLARSELNAIAILSPTNKRLLESRGKEFLQLAQVLGYPRHEKKMLRLLKTYLE
jgi:transcriptional regulator with XRE-family HTH domain